MNITRRHFILGTGLGAGALLMGGHPLLAAPIVPAVNKSFLQGHLYAFGMSPRNYPGLPERTKDFSILTSVDLAGGAMKQTPLPMGSGHAAMAMGGGRILCIGHHRNRSMVVDAGHKTLATYTAPEGYLYGGHGLVFAAQKKFILGMRATKALTKADHGRFEVYDLDTLKLIDSVDSGGLHPHEIRLIPNTDEIVVTHYGDINVNSHPLEHNAVEPKLTILDAKTLKPKRDYHQPEFNAMVTHMRVDKHGWAYYVLTQYVNFDDANKLPEGTDALVNAVHETQKRFKVAYDFPPPFQSRREKRIAVPLPFVRVNTQTGERQIIKADPKNTLRSQSVAYNAMTDTAIGLFYHSDGLVLHQPLANKTEIVTHEQLKLKEIRGVADIPNTTLIAVNGTYDDMSVYDLKTRQVVARFTSKNYDSTHLYHEADI